MNVGADREEVHTDHALIGAPPAGFGVGRRRVGSWFCDWMEMLVDADGVKGESRAVSSAEPDGAEFGFVGVDPGACLACDAGDFACVDERVGPSDGAGQSSHDAFGDPVDVARARSAATRSWYVLACRATISDISQRPVGSPRDRAVTRAAPPSNRGLENGATP
jgi:hypothetical protein